MGRGKIEIKKIENINSRQVTFSKRRQGLLKKASELAVLCDAEVAVIVYSNTGKLYKYSSSSMEQILARYSNVPESSELAIIENVAAVDESMQSELDALKAENAKLRQAQPKWMGKELEGMTFTQLQQLEQQLTEGILAIKDKKEEILLEQLKKSLMQERVIQENAAQIEELKRSSGINPESGSHTCVCLGVPPADASEKTKIPKVKNDAENPMILE